MKMVGIYKITNKINGKFYIGSTMEMEKRWRSHRNMLKNNKHHSVHLQRAYNLVGEENIEYSVIEYCNKEDLIKREQYYIETLHPEYNIQKTAMIWLGMKHSDETKRKIGLFFKGRVLTEEHKKKISLGKKNISEETRNKLRNASIGNTAFKGRKHSKEAIQKVSESRKNISEETKEKLREATAESWRRWRETGSRSK